MTNSASVVETMTNVFLWVGFAVVTGGVVALAGLVWFMAIKLMYRSTHETWWVVSWWYLKHRQGGTYEAFIALCRAIHGCYRSGSDFYPRLLEEIKRRAIDEARYTEKAASEPTHKEHHP